MLALAAGLWHLAPLPSQDIWASVADIQVLHNMIVMICARADQPRGAWAGSGLSADQGAQKGNMGTTGNMGGNTGTMGNMGSNRAGQVGI